MSRIAKIDVVVKAANVTAEVAFQYLEAEGLSPMRSTTFAQSAK